ncbi:MAG TPA: NUDIX hydrolase [Patescibacteria group bacterium]|nr:NUDIX hydrolase [Patescibacteria group bacterium]
MQHIKQAGGIVTNPKSQVLVITNQIGKHTFPKGTRENGETPEDNARREIMEESGLTNLKLVRHLGVLSRPGYTAENFHTPSVMKHIDMFAFTTDKAKLQPIASDSVKASWIDPNELSSILTWPEELAFFESCRKLLTR